MPRDPRTFITVHDGMPEHHKIEPLSDAAFRLMVESWCWCARQWTDGHIKQGAWVRRGTPEARQELIDAGLVEVTETGVYMHDYTEHQRTAGEAEALRVKRANAGRLGGTAKALANAKQVAKQTSSKPVAEKSREEKKKIGSARARTIDPDFLPEPKVRQQIAAELPHVDLKAEHAKFIDHFLANGKPMKDWTAAWRNWMRRSTTDFAPAGRRLPGPVVDPAANAPTIPVEDLEGAW